MSCLLAKVIVLRLAETAAMSRWTKKFRDTLSSFVAETLKLLNLVLRRPICNDFGLLLDVVDADAGHANDSRAQTSAQR